MSTAAPDLIEELIAIATEAIEALDNEEAITESQFGVDTKTEDFHEKSRNLRARLVALVGEGRG
jgi:hypothetical protein